MTNNLFAQFDQAYDLEGLKADIKEAANGSTNYEEVPDGDYEVHIQKLELKESKSGKPMVSGQFKIVAGSRKGQNIFMNQLVDQAFKIHIVNEFLRNLGTGLNIEFNSFSQYYNLINEVFDATAKLDFGLEYTHNSKGFAEYKITDVFEVE